jgi:hypothetical protein
MLRSLSGSVFGKVMALDRGGEVCLREAGVLWVGSAGVFVYGGLCDRVLSDGGDTTVQC